MEAVAFIIGLVCGAGVTYFVARNNQRKFNDALGIDPKAKWKEVLKEIKERLS